MFDHLDSVAMVPKHVWDAVPSDVVMSAILATAAAMCAGLDAVGGCIHPTANSTADPFIVHAGAMMCRAACESLIRYQHHSLEYGLCSTHDEVLCSHAAESRYRSRVCPSPPYYMCSTHHLWLKHLQLYICRASMVTCISCMLQAVEHE